MLKKLYRAFQNFIKYLRKGGVVYVNVSQVTYTECLKGRKALITGGGSGVGYAIHCPKVFILRSRSYHYRT